ncbi:MAG: TRAP transporter permease [Pseudodesulfovibrio sp.]|jgi:TRAP transporter 4TM/12TM fusion protein|uniref:C4-dicarboxylate ABC transporter permease n=1 Tax=Pseudodesulfovibrio indicus TaxID=1716143 RepID=A0A126QL50_9BACT|nr:TRAP transporter fused permease subunit [Pseudodesulfovibrio indicus]AMK10398.1 C4-dicarboxylate ABC transporter permease [Pseudodesulfovibrio indicus]TDT89212.1 TRAP transporter 4TM/12TM fusion protein [Pseudodesulfovibrio indicus]
MYEKLSKFERFLFDFLSVGMVLFYSWSAIFEPAATQYHRGIYVIITYILIFLIYKSRSLIMRIVDYLLMAASVLSVGYWIINFEAINYRTGIETDLDKWMAMIGVLIGIELARRVVGNVFVIIGVAMLLFGMYGAHMPELIAHAGASFPDLCTSIFYRSDGVFGIMANVLATYIILFVLFGAFLEQCGAQRFFIDWPLAAVGHKIGGPAKVSVIASGLFGSISGSAIANTVSTGSFTIPMMKKAGFKPHVAGGIEPAASIGGMFMPPIMGAGGFIMAEMTGLPYSQIMLIAIFPALMYFFSVFVMVHYEAKKDNIVGERYKENAMTIFKNEWLYTLPLVGITIFMLAGYSPGYSAIVGLAICIGLSFKDDTQRIDPTLLIVMAFMVICPWLLKLVGLVGGKEAATAIRPFLSGRVLMLYGLIAAAGFYFYRKKSRLDDSGQTFVVIATLLGVSVLMVLVHKVPAMISPEFAKSFNLIFNKEIILLVGLLIAAAVFAYPRGERNELRGFVIASRVGTINSLKIGATVGVIGIIIGVLTYSGLVLTFADIVIELAHGNLVYTILLIALASLILGMGVPVTAAYLITAVVAVPALTHLGVNEVAAHMIVYWLSQDSNITPPVCIAAFAGATIAGANMWRTAFTSFKFAKFLYLAPFLFAYIPAFSLDASIQQIVVWFAIITVVVYAYAWFMSFIWFKPLKRMLSGAPA